MLTRPMKHESTRSASICLNVKRHRSPLLVEIPLVGCFGTRSVGNAAMKSVLSKVGEAHVTDLRVVGSSHNLEEVVVFGDALERCSWGIGGPRAAIGLP